MNTLEKVKLAKAGDDNAFYELINERKGTLYKTAFLYVKNKEDALDIISDTVYKAYISINKLKEPEFFNTWLTRILINNALDFIKKSRKVTALDENHSAESSNQNNEEILDLHKAVDKLNDKYKTIVILKYFQDMTLAEIAEVLKCPLGTVKTYLHKALEMLRIELKEGDVL